MTDLNEIRHNIQQLTIKAQLDSIKLGIKISNYDEDTLHEVCIRLDDIIQILKKYDEDYKEWVKKNAKM